MKIIRTLAALLLLAALSLTLFCSCEFLKNGLNEFADDRSSWSSPSRESKPSGITESKTPENNPTENKPSESGEPDVQPSKGTPAAPPDENGKYYDLQSVVRYLDAYGKLPSNFIRKKDAEALGWSGGSVENYKEGAAIGGDYFGNMEKILPTASGRKFTECDIDTKGAKNRGAKRLVFSNDGLYFYTEDHYESFKEVILGGDGSISYGKEYK